MTAKGATRQGNYPKAKYFYFDGDTKHPYEYKQCPVCKDWKYIQKRHTYCSYSCSKSGSLNPAANIASEYHKRSAAEMVKIHEAVRRQFGKATGFTCVECGTPAHEWANQNGDYDDIYDFEPMCRSCHRTFDFSKKVKTT